MKGFIRALLLLVVGLLAAFVQYLALELLLLRDAAQLPHWAWPWSPQAGDGRVLVSFLGIQAFAAALGALFFVLADPRDLRQFRWQGMLFGGCLIFFLPLGGQLILATVVLLQCLWPHAAPLRDARDIGLPLFVPALLDRVRPGSTARARPLAANVRGGLRGRMTAMNAVREAPQHATAGLLHELLADPRDEMRLLAYGILDQAEKRIMDDIRTARASLEQHHGTRAAGADHARLAELHWELVYQRLVGGEVRQYTLQRIEEHAREALAQQEGGAADMHFLLGRCALLREAPEVALDHLGRARTAGMSDSRLAPWLAEASFQRRRFGEVVEMLRGVPPQDAVGDLQALVRYWR